MLSWTMLTPRTPGTKSIEPARAILLIVVAGIGDFVMATPAIRAVRNGYPDAEIHLLTSSEGAVFARRYPGVDQVFVFPIRALRGQRFPVRPFVSALRQLCRTRYDIAVNLYPVCSFAGSVRMAVLFGLLRARVRAGHAFSLMRFCLNHPMPDRAFFGRHRVDAMTDVACSIGGRVRDRRIEVPIAGGRDKWNRLVAPHIHGCPGKLIGINPGGDRANRRWPVASFAAAAKALEERIGARIVIFGGPGEEPIAREVLKPLNGSAVNLAGRLSLDESSVFSQPL